MKLPESFTEVTVDQFLRWQLFAFANPDAALFQHFDAMMGDNYAVNDLLDKSNPNKYIESLFGKQDEYFAKAESTVSIDVFGGVEIEKGADLFNMAMGANQMIMQIVEEINAKIHSDSAQVEAIESIKDVAPENMTDQQRCTLIDFSNKQVLAALERLPDIYAWAIVAAAGREVSDYTHTLALAALNKTQAYKVIPIFAAFFLSQLRYKLYTEPLKVLHLSFDQLLTCAQVSEKSMYLKKILSRKLDTNLLREKNK